MTQLNRLERRQFLKALSGVLGVSASASLLSLSSISSALAYQRNDIANIKAGKLFNQQQMKVLASVCQTIIPRTDTPSAAELDCHGFIDHQLTAVYGEHEQREAILLVDAIEQISVKRFGKSFIHLTEQQQQTCLINIEQKKWADAKTVKQFKQLKSLNAFGYFTSEIGATQVLTYQPVPGGYKASIPVTPNTKNYSSLAFY